MRQACLTLVSVVFLACSQDPVVPSAPTSSVRASEWTDATPVPVDAVLDVVGCPEVFQLVGTVWMREHLVSPNAGKGVVNNNWDYWWEDASFTGLTTGQVWLPLPGFTNGGHWKMAADVLVEARNHEYWRLENQTTGQVMRFLLNYHVATDAMGNVKIDELSFSCQAIP